jgi:hypothetical protein
MKKEDNEIIISDEDLLSNDDGKKISNQNDGNFSEL